MKISMKRLAALVLALVMVVGILPAMDNSVNAAATIDFSGLTDKSIGMSVTNSTTKATSTWTGSENTVTGSLAGQGQTATLFLAATDTLTITNNKSGKAKLSFDYEISGSFKTQAAKYSYVTIDGTEYKAAATGSFSKELESGESVTIVLSVVQSRTGTNQLNINITKLALAIQGGSAVDATFEAPAYGSYTVAYGDQSVTVNAGTASQVITNMPNVEYTLTANTGTEYKFVGWYNVTTGKYISTQTTYTCYVEEAATIKAVIVPKDAAVFLVGENYFSDLNEAVAYAQANSIVQITLVQSGTLEANENGYTIPAGITLLIPMDTAYTLTKTDDPDFGIAPEYTVTEAVTPYAFMTLTLAEGAKLTVNGTLDIESKHTALEGGSKRPYGGRPSGPYGAVYMSPNSNITMNDGSNLFAWGFVYGDGTVTANSGSKIYEIMQVTDFPGGSNMQNFVDVAPDTDLNEDGNPTNDYIKTFPFSQYYVQNIEVAVTLNAGASEYVYITMSVPSAELSMGLPVEFIGSGGMFNPTGGAIVKDYDPSTDRLIVDVNGDATMAGIALDLTGTQYADAMNKFLGTSKVDSATFILTLNGNISINVNSGTTEVKQDLHLLPGVEIAVAKEATLVIGQRTIADGEFDNLTIFQSGGYNVYVWDLENWGKYVFNNQSLVAASYSPTTGRYKRTASDLKDVVIDINGKVISNGFIYSTVTTDPETWLPVSGGAAVISTEKTGVLVLQNGAGFEEFAFCLDGSSSVDHFVEVDSVWLKNGDGTFVLTDAADAGTTFAYCDVHDLWYTEGHGNCVATPTHVEISWIINGQAQPMEVPYNTVPVYPVTPTKEANGCTVYTFAGWSTSANGEVLDTLPAATEETAYFAIFTESISHLGDTNNDHLCNGCNAPLSECKDDNQDHICDFAGCKDELSECTDADQNHVCDFVGCGELTSECVDANQDHICDYTGCEGELSSCDDVDQDHVCDFAGCKDELSECRDDNQNHICDFAGCGQTLSECRDVNVDHYCDYLGCLKPLSGCVDNDRDHVCDYAGCGETTSECKDDNQDHICDYTGCKDELSICVDADLDHVCDYAGCGETTSECVDDNQDHICDFAGCKDVLSECKDDNQNHVCDYVGCGETTSECVDNNQDHFCDYLGCLKTLSECVDGDDQNHNCDYTGCNKENVDDGCYGGTAYCNALAICDECGERYGSLDAGNHTGEGFYEAVSDTQHNFYHSCCGTYEPVDNCSDRDDDGDHQCDYCVNNGITDCVTDAAHACQTGTCVECGEEVPAAVDHDADNDCDKICNICEEEVWPENDHTRVNGCDTQCQYCGKEIWPDAVCESDAEYICHDGSCIWCGMPVAATEPHNWIDPDCVNDGYCGICGDPGEAALGHGTITGWDYIDYGDYHEVWCEDCWDYSYTDDHDYGDDHECDCGALEPHTVTFMNGDTVFEEVTFNHGSPLNIYGMPIPEAPAAGYGWDGWCDAQNNKLVIGMAVTSDLTFYATWKLNSYTVTWLFNGGVMDEQTKQELISEGFTVNDTSASSTFTYGDFAADAVGITKDGYELVGYTDQNGKFYEGQEKFTLSEDMTFTLVWECTHSEKTYTNLGNGFHKVTCDNCGEPLVESEGHDYTYDARNHKCNCGAVEEFKLTVVYGLNGEYTYEAMVPYGMIMADLEIFKDWQWRVFVNEADRIGMYEFIDFYATTAPGGEMQRDYYFLEGWMVRDLYVDATNYNFTGWVNDGIGWQYQQMSQVVKNRMIIMMMSDLYENGSDEELEGVYMTDDNGYRIENGLGRWYYMGNFPFNGVTYEPNAEDLAYCENNGLTFIDKDMTWYYFGADGKWQFNYTGLVGDSYVINGQAAWHIGLVQIGEDYYYFTGDSVNGGNVMVKGRDYHIGRNNTTLNVTIGGIYTFDNDGKLCRFHGITESDLFEGKRYYVGGQLMVGAGLMDLYTVSTGITNYFYVDSEGQLIVDAEYYIGSNRFGLNTGIYYFNEDGFMVIPEENSWNGFYNVDGTWYYYVNGEKEFCAGLICTTGILWYENANAEGVENQGWVYVRSNGALAIGAYYVTNTNGHGTIASGDLCIFGENGLMQETKSGIADGYYYEDNHIVYGAGLLQLDDGSYIYVRSNGQVVMGTKYWITKVNDTGIVPGTYEFDANGKMIIPVVDTYTGIREGYYYENGHVAYGLGLIEIEPGKYIYVRSNGQVATGKYWITNHNGVLTEGMYNFGEDGILVIE